MEQLKSFGKEWSGVFTIAICLFAFLSLQVLVTGLVFDSKISEFKTEIGEFKTEIIREIDSLKNEVKAIHGIILRHETEIKNNSKKIDSLKNNLISGKPN